MAVATREKPLLLLNLFLDQGVKALAGKTITFKEIPYSARVIKWGTIERSIPYPTGLITTSDAFVTVADVDGAVRDWFQNRTPLRRLGEIILDDENHATGEPWLESPDLDLPVRDEDTDSPLPDNIYNPIFSGEVKNVKYGPATVTVELSDITTAWLNRTMPNLIVRDNFPNLPYNIESAFAPIIFGRVESYGESGYDPQGVINCPYVDTTLFRFCVARHTCYEVIKVYRKRHLDAKFILVDEAEYEIIEDDISINGQDYTFTYIQFFDAPYEGTLINADVSGINYRWDFDTESQDSGEIRNPTDALINLIYFTLQNEVRIIKFNGDSFLETWDRCDARSYKCDGAVTEAATPGLIISRICSDFLIDFTQANNSQIFVHLFDPEEDSEAVVPVSDASTLLKTLKPEMSDKIFNRFRYRYARQNAPLTEFKKSSNTGQWGWEYTIDYVADQEELALSGANPILEKEIELYFVRDDENAYNVTKRRIGYHTLRSDMVAFELPIPEASFSLNLGVPVSLTHPQGVGVENEGYVDTLFKLYGLTFDLDSFRVVLRAVVFANVSDADLDSTWTGTPPVHDAQVRRPMSAAIINADEGPEDAPQVNFNDVLPIAPVDVIITDGGVSHGFANNPALNGKLLQFVNVKWQHDETEDPRLASAYVPNLSALLSDVSVTIYSGTLDPDQKPELGNDMALKALYYSTDFDRLYLFVGVTDEEEEFTAVIDTPTGWIGIQYDSGTVEFRLFIPDSVGYHLCNGDLAVPCSTIYGETGTIDTPNLTSAEHYIKSGSVEGAEADLTFTNNASLPVCLESTGTLIKPFALLPYVRL